MLPLIFGGLTAAGAAAGGVATVVQKVKEAWKKWCRKKVSWCNDWKISTGSGIYLDRYQGNGITKYLKNYCKDDKFKKVLNKLGKGDIEISTSRDGIYLNPYKKQE